MGLFLVWVYGKSLNGTHHWWSMLAILCGLLVASRSPAATGALFGLSAFFTQTHGVFAACGYAAFLIWDAHRTRRGWGSLARQLGACAAAFAVVLALTEAPYVASVGFPTLWYLEVTYSAKYIAIHHQTSLFGFEWSWHNAPNIIQRALVALVPPVVYLVTVVRCWRTDQREAMLFALVGGALFLEIASSPNWIRAYAVCMPGVVLLVWLLAPSLIRWAWAVVALLAIQQTIGRHRGLSTIVTLPAGRVATTAETAEPLVWLAQHTRPGDYFFQGTSPMDYLPLQLRNPAFVSEITNDESTRPENIARSVAELEAKQVRYVLWTRFNEPDPEHPQDDHLAALRTYLDERYRKVQTFPDQEEILERLP
jgi:hypothetical protein